MNTVVMMGRLVADPVVRYTTGEKSTAVANMRLAVDRRFKRDGQPDADFFDCVAFGKLGEFAEKYLRKGSKVVVQGSLENNNYKNLDGAMVYRNIIRLAEIDFAESKAAAANNAPASSTAAPAKKAAPAPVDDDGFMTIPDSIDEELPFN